MATWGRTPFKTSSSPQHNLSVHGVHTCAKLQATSPHLSWSLLSRHRTLSFFVITRIGSPSRAPPASCFQWMTTACLNHHYWLPQATWTASDIRKLRTLRRHEYPQSWLHSADFTTNESGDTIQSSLSKNRGLLSSLSKWNGQGWTQGLKGHHQDHFSVCCHSFFLYIDLTLFFFKKFPPVGGTEQREADSRQFQTYILSAWEPRGKKGRYTNTPVHSVS